MTLLAFAADCHPAVCHTAVVPLLLGEWHLLQAHRAAINQYRLP